MKRILKTTFLGFAFVVALLLPFAATAEIKGHFDLIAPAAPPADHSLDQVTIHEVFSFGCPHCYNLNNELPALKKKFGSKIKIIPMPIGWQGTEPGKLLFLAEELGKGEKVKDMIFDFYHRRGLGESMYSRDKLRFVAQLNDLSEPFKTRMDDPKIVEKMNESMAFAQRMQVTGTPTLILEGVLKTHGDISNLTVIINSLLKKPVQ